MKWLYKIGNYFTKYKIGNYFTKYNIVNLRLKNDYYETEYRMERALVVLFIDFVQRECGGIDNEIHGLLYHSKCKEYPIKRRNGYKKLIAAYYFFKYERNILKRKIKFIDSMYMDAANYKIVKIGNQLNLKEKELIEKEKKHLDSIWKYRHELWT